MTTICAFDVASRFSQAWWEDGLLEIEMNGKAILKFLTTLPEGTAIVMEATGRYHEKIAKAAFRLGFPVYVLNPRDTSAYRKWTGRRVKTDAADAKMLHAFARDHFSDLRRYVPKQARLATVHELLRIRNQLVESRVSIRQSLNDSSGALKHLLGDPCAELSAKIKLCEELIEQFLAEDEGFRRLKKVPGLKTISAAAMVCAYGSGEFKKADSFVAFLGLDVHVCQSGQFEGKRKLTKRGNPLYRKILTNSAAAANHSHAFQGYYFNFLERNMVRRYRGTG